MNTSACHCAAAALALALATGAQAAVIQLTDLSIFSGAQLVTFDDVTGAVFPGTNYDGILVSGGVGFAERFVGQDNSPDGDFDVLSGTPNNPLTLAPGSSGENVVVYLPTISSTTRVMAGLGPAGFDDANAIGEGSIAVLFASDLLEFGFTLTGAGGGEATLDFFRRDGTLINRIVLQLPDNGDYGFGQDNGLAEIAGVSIFNNDGGGIGFDTFRYNVATGQPNPNPNPNPIPEPSSLGLGLLGLALLTVSKAKASQTWRHLVAGN